MVGYVCNRVAEMYLGRIVEIAPRNKLWQQPLHPYTRALLDAAPLPDPTRRRGRRIMLDGEIPSPVNPLSGCRFRTRYPLQKPRCATETPHVLGAGEVHLVACHRAFETFS